MRRQFFSPWVLGVTLSQMKLFGAVYSKQCPPVVRTAMFSYASVVTVVTTAHHVNFSSLQNPFVNYLVYHI